MSTIQTIFGLQSRQLIEPQLFDVKLLHDQTALWRAKVRGCVIECRVLRDQISASRHLSERYYLGMVLESEEQAVRTAWQVYRSVSRAANALHGRYLENLEKRIRKLGLIPGEEAA